MATRGEIGKKIRLARKGLGYTQKSLAEKTKVNKKNLTCPNGMKLKQYFRKMMNEIIYRLYHLVFTSNNAKSTTT
ncbi:hypothetical protein L289_3796 [Acinetobacter gerneri DSM 14967 = CIP 107464 = MTCC 9824]|uniref:Uncharacterized protein n=2 Tax=Acinetobacter gerneri TaxID=202952 RepID=N8YFN7_9GAMM|nr:hypothetical protein F960_00141 [Acinetobacter gerneri DSM 14967 = CIP 107464 = MTCC 9824]EPR81394.1 hypothetical protein L289_3796 [Acinetobacter gerneri DSM 14967 = CIP 107464 = MTCC 9824]